MQSIFWGSRGINQRKARGRIHTPSYAQVVQPLYKSASDRWRAYEHHLTQERTRLSDWITAYGYDT